MAKYVLKVLIDKIKENFGIGEGSMKNGSFQSKGSKGTIIKELVKETRKIS